MKCKRCGELFDVEETKYEFENETLKNYDFLKIKLCANCAIDAIRMQEGGIYYDYCDKCGKSYDPIVDESRFEELHTNEYGTYANIGDMTNEQLCLDCAIDEYNK